LQNDSYNWGEFILNGKNMANTVHGRFLDINNGQEDTRLPLRGARFGEA